MRRSKWGVAACALILGLVLSQCANSQPTTRKAAPSSGALFTQYTSLRTGCGVTVAGGTPQTSALAWLEDCSSIWRAAFDGKLPPGEEQKRLEALVTTATDRGLLRVSGLFSGTRLTVSSKAAPAGFSDLVTISAQDTRTGAAVVVSQSAQDGATKEWLSSVGLRTPAAELEALVSRAHLQGLLAASSHVETEAEVVEVRAFWAEREAGR